MESSLVLYILFLVGKALVQRLQAIRYSRRVRARILES